jgi:hypothetical protein
VNNQKLNEGLRPLDLKDMVYPIIEVDTYRSKMGEDRDVCVISFQAKDRNPAKDMMEFIEKGYNFVLDADVSSGENSKGEYHIFVELDRTPKLSEQIQEIAYGIKKLTGISEWKFRYHKSDRNHDLSEENLSRIIPRTPSMYEGMMHKEKVESVKKFFSKTLMDDLTIDDSVITIHKPFGKQVKLKWLQEDDPQAIVETAPAVDDSSTAEIFWLTKVLGDYDISKFGEKLLFTNSDRAMLLQRTEK